MDIRYERDGSGVFMVLPGETGDGSYIRKMLLEGEFENLLSVKERHVNGETSLCYDVRAMQSLQRVFDSRQMQAKDVLLILTGLERAVGELSDYLLDPGVLLLDPECVMMRQGGELVRFCCHPEADGYSAAGLGDFLISHVDNEDEDAVRLSYGFYELAATGSFDLGNLLHPEDMAGSTDISGLPISESGPDEGEAFDPEFMPVREAGFYYAENEPPEEEIELPRRELLRPLVICAAIIILLGGAYIYVFMHPDLLSHIGLRQEDYIAAGAVMTALGALGIVLGLQKYFDRQSKLRVEEEKEREETGNGTAREDAGEMTEFEEIRRQDPDEETTILAVKEDTGECDFFLVGLTEGQAVKATLKGSPFTVGKSPGLCDLVLDAPGISRVHAVFEHSVSGWYVSDENSTNGTRVNGVLIHDGQHAVFPGDRISFGEYDFVLVEVKSGNDRSEEGVS